MIKYITAFKDDVAGSFDYFGTFVNVELAKRNFRAACSAEGCPAADLSLYVIGCFDTDTGAVFNFDDDLGNFPQYIMRGVSE